MASTLGDAVSFLSMLLIILLFMAMIGAPIYVISKLLAR